MGHHLGFGLKSLLHGCSQGSAGILGPEVLVRDLPDAPKTSCKFNSQSLASGSLEVKLFAWNWYSVRVRWGERQGRWGRADVQPGSWGAWEHDLHYRASLPPNPRVDLCAPLPVNRGSLVGLLQGGYNLPRGVASRGKRQFHGLGGKWDPLAVTQ